MTHTPLGWMAAQIERAADGRRDLPLQIPRYNPRPAGKIVKGSATDAVLTLLQSRPLAWLTHGQLVVHTGRSTKSVCWACMYLSARGLVETGSDSRSTRYQRYRMAQPAKSPAHHMGTADQEP